MNDLQEPQTYGQAIHTRSKNSQKWNKAETHNAIYLLRNRMVV